MGWCETNFGAKLSVVTYLDIGFKLGPFFHSETCLGRFPRRWVTDFPFRPGRAVFRSLHQLAIALPGLDISFKLGPVLQEWSNFVHFGTPAAILILFCIAWSLREVVIQIGSQVLRPTFGASWSGNLANKLDATKTPPIVSGHVYQLVQS